MGLNNTHNSYGSVTKILHWLIFVLIVCMLLVGFFMDDIGDKSLRKEVINIHKLTGLTILVIMLFRVCWSLVNPKPDLPQGTPLWQIFAERVVHRLFYILLILIPISGWVMSVAGGHPPVLGPLTFYLPISTSKPLSNTAFDLHSWLAIAIIVLISVHVLAALYHYVVKKDDVLQRMLPRNH